MRAAEEEGVLSEECRWGPHADSAQVSRGWLGPLAIDRSPPRRERNHRGLFSLSLLVPSSIFGPRLVNLISEKYQLWTALKLLLLCYYPAQHFLKQLCFSNNLLLASLLTVNRFYIYDAKKKKQFPRYKFEHETVQDIVRSLFLRQRRYLYSYKYIFFMGKISILL